MLKNIKITRKKSTFFLFFFGVLFFYLYFFSPLQTFQSWNYHLILLGLSIPLLFFGQKIAPNMLPLLILALLFNYSLTGLIPSPNLKNLDFIIQCGLFFWGIETGARFFTKPAALKPKLSPVLLWIILFPLFFIITNDPVFSALLAVLISTSSFNLSQSSSVLVSYNIISYAAAVAIFCAFISPISGIVLLLLLLVFWALNFIYQQYLKNKVKTELLLFLLAIAMTILVYFFPQLPVFILGIAAGVLFYQKNPFKINFFTEFYKIILILLLLSQTGFHWFSLLLLFGLLVLLILLRFISSRTLSDSLTALPLELPLAFYPALKEHYAGNYILMVIFLVCALSLLIKPRKVF